MAGATGAAVDAGVVANSDPVATMAARRSILMFLSFAFALGFDKPLSTPGRKAIITCC
jgi:hypothetical protein